MQTQAELARAPLIASGPPRFLWGEAMKHVAWLKDRSPCSALDCKSPYEMKHKKVPHLGKIHEFGTAAYVKNLLLLAGVISIRVHFSYHPISDCRWLLVIRWQFLGSLHYMKLWEKSTCSLWFTFWSNHTCNVLYSYCYNERSNSCKEDFRFSTGCWRCPQWWVSAWYFLSYWSWLLISLHFYLGFNAIIKVRNSGTVEGCTQKL